MLSKQDAIDIVGEAFPDAQLSEPVVYKELYLLQVFPDDPDEGVYDPFYSVNQTTGELLEFPLFLQDDVPGVLSLFPEV